jgi:hypothetical protein
MIMHKHSIARKINSLVSKAEPGTVLTTQDFMRFGSRAAADNTLSRMVKDGRIVRVAAGIYYVPKVSARLGTLSPSPDQIAQAMGRRTGTVVQPVGAAAANALGLSPQVPARAVYITNGKSRRRRVGSAVIELKHAAPKTLAGAGTRAGSVLHALRYLGKRGLTSEVLTRVNTQLTDSDRRQLRKLIPSAPAWMHPALKRLTSAGPRSEATGEE